MTSHCQHGIEYDDPDGPCEACTREFPQAPKWIECLPTMQAQIIQLEFQMDKLFHQVMELKGKKNG